MTLQVDLTHRLPGFTLRAAFQAPPGVTAVFGASGAGKTTLVHAVAGLLRPDRGRITCDGTVLCDTAAGQWLPPHRRRIGYVFQEGRLFPHLTVRQNLLYGRWFAPRGAAGPDLAQVVDLLGIGALLARRPGTLSGGEKQRVAIGRAMLACPRLLLLDEPLAALDAARKAEILPYLERLRDETGLPMLLVSHALSEVARLAGHLVVLDHGQMIAAGAVETLLSDPALAPHLGLRAAGAVIEGRLAQHDPDGLSRIDTAAGPLWLPQIAGQPGARVRLRVLAQDVMLALTRPTAISAQNILPARITALQPDGASGLLVQLDAGGAPLLAHVTNRAAAALALAPGLPVFAVIKAVAPAPEDLGR